MRIPVKIYKSFLATLLSIFSLVFPVLGLVLLLEFIGTGEIFLIIIGVIIALFFVGCYILCQALAKAITERKMTKKWLKEISEKGADTDIASSVDFAVLVYNTNPHKLTLEYIEKLNPLAAEMIRNNLAQKKELKKQKKRKNREE